MPIVNIQISDVKRVKDNVSFIATSGNDVIERTLNINTVDGWQDFAGWLIGQQADYNLMPNKEKSLSITFHTETVIDPETGEEATIRVVDNVIVT